MQIDMGTNEDNKKSKWITKLPYLLILFTSLFISIVGGCVLGWWLHKYHPTNSQLWMVPFGFVLFLTPIIVLLSILVPDLCISKSDKQVNHSEPK
jgi:ABC-type proline/glycine betaine transport system permease subunit